MPHLFGGAAFFVSMPEAHSWTRCHGAFPPSGMLIMQKDKQDV